MDILSLMSRRHSVRRYTDKPIEKEKLDILRSELERCNAEGGLHIQLVTDEPDAFTGALASYGHFSGVRNYIVLAGKKADDLEERVGYYGERLVLLAQELGLNTCWVALTFSRRRAKFTLNKGEKLVCVISLGYGITQGKPHRSKPFEEFFKADGEIPAWFESGVRAAMLAPTAINQQKFVFRLSGNTVEAAAMKGPCSEVDLGIVRYHFELGAGRENFRWANTK